MRRRAFLASALLLAARAPFAAEPYPAVVPGMSLRFPHDHGSHPEFRTEWWYVTGSVADAAGHEYGVQITFFRNRPNVGEDNPSAFAPRQLLFAHAAIADASVGHLRHDQRAAREGFGLAQAAAATTQVTIGDWSLALADDGYHARIPARGFALDLNFSLTQPILLQGDAGYSRKGPDPRQASWYYSRPQLAVAGEIVVDGRKLSVTGRAWLDHEWSSEAMASAATGWDWTGINFDDGGALMAFRMRDASGSALWAAATWRAPDGVTRVYGPDAIRFTPGRRWRSPRTQTEYPVAWSLVAGDLDIALEPLMDDQELDARASTGTIYWEGAVRALQGGRATGRTIGRGYLELTGYGKPLKF
ncbi:MAG: carotenoid 1,2-hydratase [Aromatoleum sp.]|nr:carotenoid 1,2-hydratase [Aromatoleum sp.]